MPDVRLIDANALDFRFDTLCAGDCGCCRCHDSSAAGHGCKLISSAPTIDAVPIVHGRWEDATEYIAGIRYPQTRCSACKHVYWEYRTECNYCPNCGAKMDGGAENG